MMFSSNGVDEDDNPRPGRPEIDTLFSAALQEWDRKNAQIGDTISAEWFYDLLGVLHPSKANSYERSVAQQKMFMMLFHGQDGFRFHVLTHRKRWLKTNYAGGYEVMPPEEQTRYAQKQRRNDITKALKDESTLLSNVEMARLSIKQREQNSDAIAHNVALMTMLSRKKPGFGK